MWHSADESPVLSGSDVASMTDLSGNGRTVSCATNRPVYAAEVAAANNMPAITFNGSTTNPLTNTSPVTLYSIFIVASYDTATFASDYRGLIGGVVAANPACLVGETGQSRFLDNGYGSSQVYRMANHIYANASMSAPMSGVPRVIEIHFTGGHGQANGLQIGRDRDYSARIWDGYVYEWMVYTRVLTDAERMRMYKYFAHKYHLWEQVSGLDVFPAVADWGSQETYGKKVLAEDAEDYTRHARIKRMSKRRFELNFTNRLPNEHNAVKAFYDVKHPSGEFIYRDRTVYPAEDVTVRFAADAEIEHIPTNHLGFGYKTKLVET